MRRRRDGRGRDGRDGGMAGLTNAEYHLLARRGVDLVPPHVAALVGRCAEHEYLFLVRIADLLDEVGDIGAVEIALDD